MGKIIIFCLKCECRKMGEIWFGPHCICTTPLPFVGTAEEFQKAYLEHRLQGKEEGVSW